MNARTMPNLVRADAIGSGQQTRLARHLLGGCALTAILFGLVGCDKIPTWDELVHGKKKEAPKVTAPPPQQPMEPPKAAPVVQAPPAPPAKAPQEVIAEFNTTPHERRTDKMLFELANMREGKEQITDLDLSFSQGITEAGIRQLPKLDHVEKLTLDYCLYGNAALQDVAKMNSVTTLSIKGGAMKDKNSDLGLGFIKEMKQLTSLTVDHIPLTETALQNIAAMTWLEQLSMSDTNLNDEGLASLKGLTHLKSLIIANTTVSDDGFQYLAPFQELESLNVGVLRSRMTGKGLYDVVSQAHFPSLRAVYLGGNRSLGQKTYEGLYRLRGTLEVLDLSDTTVNDYYFVGAVSKLSKLLDLNLSRNAGLTDQGMLKLPNLHSLKAIRFEKSPAISDHTCLQIAKLKNLEFVGIAQTAITQRGAQRLKKKLPKAVIYFEGARIE
jgi:Leucine Rich repeat